MLLTKDQILAADDRPHEDIAVPEWGGTVRVRRASGLLRDAIEVEIYRERQAGGRVSNFRARMAAACIVGDDGQPLFTLEDVEALGAKSGRALDRVYEACQRVNGFTDADAAELEKN